MAQKRKTTKRKLPSLPKRNSKSKSTSRARKTSSRSTSSSKAKQPQTGPSTSLWADLSLDRKLDIIGVVMAVVGLVTLFGLLSVNNGWLMGNWVTLLARLFGWGVYFVPVGLIIFGAWLILRKFDRLPTLSLERGLGIGMLFLLLLVVMHFALIPEDVDISRQIAFEGSGGGYIGGGVLHLLQLSLGWAGAAIALAALFLLALGITLDKSIAEMFSWISPLILRIQDTWDELQDRLVARTRRSSTSNIGTTPPIFDGASQAQAAVLAQAGAAVETDSDSPLVRTWVLPPVEEILDDSVEIPVDDEFDRQRAQNIEETLAHFGAPASVVEINRGPTITQFGVEPDFIETRNRRTRVRVNKIASLADDLALALAATRIRIEAPVPGKGYVGIEVPNEQTALVTLSDGIETEAFRRLNGKPLRFALGQDVAGNAVAADLAAMPHLLIAGTTGSGKSVCVNAIISSFLVHNTPDEVRMLMVDPKRVELTGYNGIPHLLAPVVVEMDRVVGALQWATREMDQRYHKFSEVGARNILDYNQIMASQNGRKLPYLVVIIDELADLMMLAPDETERTITRMAQLARATGIHMVISTQRPSVDVVTGLIKANFPARIAFAVASGTDSRVILDQPGAERLLGRGDMLFQAPDAAAPVRLQGVNVTDHELLRLVQYWRAQAGHTVPSSLATAAGGYPDALPPNVPLKQMPLWETEEVDLEPEEDLDPLYDEALDLIRRQGRASISMLQRRLRIGYTRAARLIETMEEKEIIGPPQPGAQTRDVIDYGQAAPPEDD
jgi:S-DNA-T family DNA segregation ATPase FtsK/SpoIIIE